MSTTSLLLEYLDIIVAGMILGIVGFLLITQWMSQKINEKPPEQTLNGSDLTKQRRSKAAAYTHIRHLLTQNGGRMRQKQIVDATDWSKATISVRLSEMEADGQLAKFRLGRENIITLSEDEPDTKFSEEKYHRHVRRGQSRSTGDDSNRSNPPR